MQNKFFGSKLNTVLLLVLIILMVIALRWMYQDKNTYIPVTNQNQIIPIGDTVYEEDNDNSYRNPPSDLVTSGEDGTHNAIIKGIMEWGPDKTYLSVDYVEVYGGVEGMRAAREDGVCNNDEECSIYVVRYTRNKNPQLRSFEVNLNTKFIFDQEYYSLEDFKRDPSKYNGKFQNCLSNLIVKDSKITSVSCGSAG